MGDSCKFSLKPIHWIFPASGKIGCDHFGIAWINLFGSSIESLGNGHADKRWTASKRMVRKEEPTHSQIGWSFLNYPWSGWWLVIPWLMYFPIHEMRIIQLQSLGFKALSNDGFLFHTTQFFFKVSPLSLPHYFLSLKPLTPPRFDCQQKCFAVIHSIQFSGKITHIERCFVHCLSFLFDSSCISFDFSPSVSSFSPNFSDISPWIWQTSQVGEWTLDLYGIYPLVN